MQCKTARMNEDNTALIFNTSIKNVTGNHRQPRNYRGQCDFFAAYCEELNKVYLVPVDDVGAISANLRLAPPKITNKNIYVGLRITSCREEAR